MADYVRRLPVYLLLDTSGSMSGEPIEAVRQDVIYARNAMEEMRTLAIPRFINFVVTKSNFSEIEELILLAKQYGVEKICILKPFGKQLKDQRLDKGELLALHQIVQREKDYLAVENCYLEYWSVVGNRDGRCLDAAQTSYFFRWDGKVQPCSKYGGEGFDTVDDLKKTVPNGTGCFCE